MSVGALGLVALGFYLVGLFVVAALARRARRDDSPGDHFLAARELGVFVLFLTLYATTYSGNSLIGYPGEAYRSGFAFVMATGFMMAIVVFFHALAPKLRPLSARHGFVTPGDFLRWRFGEERLGRALRVAVALVMIFALSNFLFSQLRAMGELATEATGGLVPYELGVVGLAAVILFYETTGGMRAVAWTDAVQAGIMFAGLGAMIAWLLSTPGGLAGLSSRIAELRPDAVVVPSAATRANWASTILLLGIGSTLYPQAIQRIYAASSSRTLKRAFALMTWMPLVTTAVVTMIGLAAITRLPELAGVDADRVMPALLAQWAEDGLASRLAAVIVFLAAIAAIMSTADSVLLSAGSLVATDLLDRPRDAPATTLLGKRAAAALFVAMIAFAMRRDLTLWRITELKMEVLVQCAPAFLLAIHWPGLRAGPTLSGVVVGTALAAGSVLAGVERFGGVHAGLLALAANALVATLGSLRR